MAVLDDQLVGFIAATKESIAHLYARWTSSLRYRHQLSLGQRSVDGKLWLHAFARNATRAFYEKHGFVIVARGFEPTWQLDDIKYEWAAQHASV